MRQGATSSSPNPAFPFLPNGRLIALNAILDLRPMLPPISPVSLVDHYWVPNPSSPLDHAPNSAVIRAMTIV